MTCGAFGWKPRTFWKATIPEVLMTVKGWNKAQGAVEPMTRDDLDDLVGKYGAPTPSIAKKSEAG